MLSLKGTKQNKLQNKSIHVSVNIIYIYIERERYEHIHININDIGQNKSSIITSSYITPFSSAPKYSGGTVLTQTMASHQEVHLCQPPGLEACHAGIYTLIYILDWIDWFLLLLACLMCLLIVYQSIHLFIDVYKFIDCFVHIYLLVDLRIY